MSSAGSSLDGDLIEGTTGNEMSRIQQLAVVLSQYHKVYVREMSMIQQVAEVLSNYHKDNTRFALWKM